MLCTTFAMGMAITNLWKLFHYGVNRYKYKYIIGIRELLERLALDCFNNSFSTDTPPPEKNTPPLDEVDEGETVSTFREIKFSSSIYPSTEVRNISNITLNNASSISYSSATFTIESHHTAER